MFVLWFYCIVLLFYRVVIIVLLFYRFILLLLFVPASLLLCLDLFYCFGSLLYNVCFRDFVSRLVIYPRVTVCPRNIPSIFIDGP